MRSQDFLLGGAHTSGGSRKFWWGDFKHKPSKIRMSSPKLRVMFGPELEIRTFFPPKIRWSPKKKKKKRSSPKLRVIFRPKSEIRTFFPPKIRWSPKKTKQKVFTEIESDFLAEFGNSNVFSAQNQVVSKKKKKRSESDFSAEIGNSNVFSAQNQVVSKKKRPSPKLREVFRPKPLALLLIYCLITVICVITGKKLQLNIARLCCHNFLSLVEF